MTDTPKFDAARLDDIQAAAQGERGAWIYLEKGEVIALIQAARRGLRYRALIDDHNAVCICKCANRGCGMKRLGDSPPELRCGNCPADYMIELPAAAGEGSTDA